VLPNFFRQAPGTGPLLAGLWAFTQVAYLDCPLPSLFKERLFVHLSRFCEVRYCIIRHACFLAGLGRPAGDPDAPPQTVEQITGLLRRPVPDPATLEAALRRLEVLPGPAAMPGPGTQLEADLLDVLAIIFLDAEQAARARAAVTAAAGNPAAELLLGLLAFIRTAHYWTETHPDLPLEPDAIAFWTSTRSSPGCWPTQRTQWRPARGRPGTPPPPTSWRPGKHWLPANSATGRCSSQWTPGSTSSRPSPATGTAGTGWWKATPPRPG
jgi:hypothetical protein